VTFVPIVNVKTQKNKEMGQLRNRFPQADILPLKRLSHLQAALTHLSGSLQDLRQGGPM